MSAAHGSRALLRRRRSPLRLRSRRCTSLALAAAIFFAFARPARAQAPELGLRAHVTIGSAAAPCVGAAELGARVDDILGRDAVSDEGELHVVVDARETESGTALVVALSDASGVRAEREVVHASAPCETLVGTLSVVVALMLDDRVREASLDVTRAVHVPERAPAVAAPAVAIAGSPPGDRVWIGFGAGVAMAIGLLPDVVPGAELRGEVGVAGSASGALSLTVFPWGAARGAPGGEFTAFTASLAGCTPRSTDARPLSIAGCAGVSAGAIRGVATMVERAIERLEPLVALDVYADLAVDVAGPLGLALRLGVSVPLARPSFFARVAGERVAIHEPWPVIPMATLAFFLAERE